MLAVADGLAYGFNAPLQTGGALVIILIGAGLVLV